MSSCVLSDKGEEQSRDYPSPLLLVEGGFFFFSPQTFQLDANRLSIFIAAVTLVL